ncbi:MFS transporter [Amycolatopsis sp. K13G38]|uniref:MFS transporter n=1 Tax=Amycolatopsis acididurans TaxID=2724524 RepID=A0ABX1JGJ6_9PSEU|nr:MFS transporter [Amycolatopsis acididurans]NKQ57661.1 MFS transporter [Amycolatopsis acididurans]
MDVITTLRTSRMGLARWCAVALCVLCNTIDGLDLMLMSYALPHLPPGFATGTQKGLLISFGFLGMGLGATLLAPLADRIGRKRMVMYGLLLSVLALAATALSPSMEWMLAARILAGAGAGTLTPVALTLGDEFSSAKRRGLCVGLVAIGFAIGSTIGGLIGLFIITTFGGAWQALFWGGALISAAVLVLAAALPESPAYLVIRDTAEARQRLARVVSWLGLTGVELAEQPLAEPVATGQKAGVLTKRFRGRTLLLWLGYSTAAAAWYFTTSWTPQLVSTVSGSAERGTLMGTVLSMGSLGGGVVFILLATRVSSTAVVWVCTAAGAVAAGGFALTITGAGAVVTAAAIGVTMQAALSAYVASCARLYPTVIRTRAQGALMGVSRVGTILVPVVVGAVLTGLSAQTMYWVATVVVLLSAIVGVTLWSRTRAITHAPVGAGHPVERLEAVREQT